MAMELSADSRHAPEFFMENPSATPCQNPENHRATRIAMMEDDVKIAAKPFLVQGIRRTAKAMSADSVAPSRKTTSKAVARRSPWGLTIVAPSDVAQSTQEVPDRPATGSSSDPGLPRRRWASQSGQRPTLTTRPGDSCGGNAVSPSRNLT